jgi:uncharacterized protein (DUF433 family)
VADPEICHGKPTFRGTRIMAWQVLEMAARGMRREATVEEWDGKVNKEAIAEAIRAASKALAAQETRRARETDLELAT